MEIRSLCESYFSGFNEISGCCKNDKATNALAVLNDSMVNYGNAKEIENSLQNIAKNLSDLEGKPYRFKRKINRKIQNDGYSCGLWVAYFVEERMKNPEVDFNTLTNTDNVMKTFRAKAYEQYINIRKHIRLKALNRE